MPHFALEELRAKQWTMRKWQWTMPDMRVVLFGLTGYGNTVLEALLKDKRVEVPAVFTFKYDNPFPYYNEEALVDVCARKGLACHYDVKVSSDEGCALLKGYRPDLVIVAAFRQIIKPSVFAIPPMGIVNVHPSILPKYRGVCPTNHTILHGDTETAVSMHYLTEEIDAGDILLQRKVMVDAEETDSSLRKKTAIVAGEMIPELIGLFASGKKPEGRPQDLSKGSLAPRPLSEDGYLDGITDSIILSRKIRGLNPHPGTSIMINGKRIPVDSLEALKKAQSVHPYGFAK